MTGIIRRCFNISGDFKISLVYLKTHAFLLDAHYFLNLLLKSDYFRTVKTYIKGLAFS